MSYPLISEYIEAIKSAEDNFKELSYLRPVLGDDGNPIMTSGNFAVVFKMKDIKSGKFYALKCFIKEEENREEAYYYIEEELENTHSPYLVSFRYITKELFVDTAQTDETEFPVLLMDWVEGTTLDKYIEKNISDSYVMNQLSYNFNNMSCWLLSQEFAHGDLKPDNIMVRLDGSLVLVDYDGMYVEALWGDTSELGSPDFRHPQRTEENFDMYIDDFPAILISLSLKAITLRPGLYKKYNKQGNLLFTERDFLNLRQSNIIIDLESLVSDSYFYKLYELFLAIWVNYNTHLYHEKLIDLLDNQTIDIKLCVKQNISQTGIHYNYVKAYGVITDIEEHTCKSHDYAIGVVFSISSAEFNNRFYEVNEFHCAKWMYMTETKSGEIIGTDGISYDDLYKNEYKQTRMPLTIVSISSKEILRCMDLDGDKITNTNNNCVIENFHIARLGHDYKYIEKLPEKLYKKIQWALEFGNYDIEDGDEDNRTIQNCKRRRR